MNQARGHATSFDQYRFFAIFDHRGFRLSRIERDKRGGGTPNTSGPDGAIAALLKPDSLREKALIKQRPMLTKRPYNPQFARALRRALSRYDLTVRMRVVWPNYDGKKISHFDS
jgi:hypothetical protein